MNQSDPSQAPTSARRSFLKGVAAAGGAVAGAAVVGPAAASTSVQPQAPRAADRGYRETAHVKDYYRTARL